MEGVGPRSAVKEHCSDNAADREVGATWERKFAALVGRYKHSSLTPHQIGRTRLAAKSYYRDDEGWRALLLPDITLWRAPGEHHEIKHKSPTDSGSYGLEEYRIKALCEFAMETEQTVLYTIHDWRLAGAESSRDETPNLIEHWRTSDVLVLWGKRTAPVRGFSWVGGKKVAVPIHYWPTSLWSPLATWWEVEERGEAA
jgi:hypothetical protein